MYPRFQPDQLSRKFIVVQCMVGDELIPPPTLSTPSGSHRLTLAAELIRCGIGEVESLFVRVIRSVHLSVACPMKKISRFTGFKQLVSSTAQSEVERPEFC